MNNNSRQEDNLIQNQTKWPEIFGLTEAEIIEAGEAFSENKQEHDGKSSQSYKDWCQMYNGVHRERFPVCDDGSDPPMLNILGLKASQAHGIMDPGVAPSARYTNESRVKAIAEFFLQKR